MLFGDTQMHSDAFAVFGVDEATARQKVASGEPLVALHDTVEERHAVMHLTDGFQSVDTQGTSFAANVRHFVAAFLNGTVPTVSDDTFIERDL